MAIELSGGCRVSLLREGAAKEQGTLRDWQHAGRENGAAAISLRVLELAPGRSPRLGGTACDEVLYVFEGQGTLHFEGGSRSIGPDTGVYVPPGASFEIENSQALTLVSSRCPDPGDRARPLLPRLLSRQCSRHIQHNHIRRAFPDHIHNRIPQQPSISPLLHIAIATSHLQSLQRHILAALRNIILAQRCQNPQQPAILIPPEDPLIARSSIELSERV